MTNDQLTYRTLSSVNEQDLAGLTAVLIDCVEGGASVSFMLPFSAATARAFWMKVGAGVDAGSRLVVVAEDDQGICGTVQLILDLPDNQPHRADVAKMLVHRRARRRGVAQELLRRIEEEAKHRGRTLLVLDTVTDSDAHRLYTRLGWQRVGDIPKYALMPDGPFCSTTYFYKDLDPKV